MAGVIIINVDDVDKSSALNVNPKWTKRMFVKLVGVSFHVRVYLLVVF